MGAEDRRAQIRRTNQNQPALLDAVAGRKVLVRAMP
jgi:hypothetical protein